MKAIEGKSMTRMFAHKKKNKTNFQTKLKFTFQLEISNDVSFNGFNEFKFGDIKISVKDADSEQVILK